MTKNSRLLLATVLSVNFFQKCYCHLTLRKLAQLLWQTMTVLEGGEGKETSASNVRKLAYQHFLGILRGACSHCLLGAVVPRQTCGSKCLWSRSMRTTRAGQTTQRTSPLLPHKWPPLSWWHAAPRGCRCWWYRLAPATRCFAAARLLSNIFL